MTREEAIKVLEMFLHKQCDLARTKFAYDANTVWEAVNIASKALEQGPNEVCDWFKQYIDIPSNTVLIEFSDGTSKRVKRGGYLANVENDLRRIIQVQIERESYEDAIRPKGHWILTDVEGNKVWHCHCSECNKDPQDYIGGSEDWWLIRNNLPKVCPNCGAEMEEVRKKNDT